MNEADTIKLLIAEGGYIRVRRGGQTRIQGVKVKERQLREVLATRADGSKIV